MQKPLPFITLLLLSAFASCERPKEPDVIVVDPSLFAVKTPVTLPPAMPTAPARPVAPVIPFRSQLNALGGAAIQQLQQVTAKTIDAADRGAKTLQEMLDESAKKITPAKQDDYKVAYEAYTADADKAKSFQVLVGADWCTPCKEVNGWLPKFRERGYFAYLDLDKEQKLADEVAGPGSIPRLVVWTTEEGLLVRRMYVGAEQIKQYVFPPSVGVKPDGIYRRRNRRYSG